ncbi:MAG: hypothetical protein V9G63_04990 [Candidatus Competibacter sp.]|nr:hypothetical protein [Candidatus Competibacteraceae bacterium]
MSDFDVLRKMIKDSSRLELDDYYSRNQVTLCEPQDSDYSVCIRGLPEDTVIIKADDFRSPDTIFKGEHGECKRADFLIIAESNDKVFILIIEMKRRKGLEKEVIKQLVGTRCFLSYVIEIGRAFWQQNTFLNNCVYRFISINHISIAKGKTKVTRTDKLHDRPERMLKIAYSGHLEFKHLAGRSR